MMKETIRGELNKFCRGTSIKGLSRMIHAEVFIVKIFWAAAVVTCFALMLFQIISVVVNYYSYQTVDNLQTSRSIPTFPDVTVCNLFQIESSSSSDWKTFITLVNQSRDLWDIDKAILDDPFCYVSNQPHFGYKTDDVRDFIVECLTFGWELDDPNNCSDITAFFSPLYGKCYTISTPVTITALTLILYIDNFFQYPLMYYDPYSNIPTALGAKIMIHPKSTYPSDNAGINVSPGNEARITLMQKNITRLPTPYGNCTAKIKLDITGEKAPTMYSTNACLVSCRHRQVIEQCGCYDSTGIYIPAEIDLKRYVACTNLTNYLGNMGTRENPYIQDVERFHCYMYDAALDYFSCDCQSPCSETHYDFRTSTARWPNPLLNMAFYSAYIKNKNYSDKFQSYLDIQKKFRDNDEDMLTEIRKLNLIEENFVRVVVQFENPEVIQLTERPAITWDTLASNLGGSLNLWLGISIITVAELLELVYTLVSIKRMQMNMDQPD